MSNFRRDDESPAEYADRVERCEVEASRYFTRATKPQAERYTARMAVNDAYRGAPRWERERNNATSEFKRTTAAASELYELTFAELMTSGEVSEALSFRWDELAVADAMLQAAE